MEDRFMKNVCNRIKGLAWGIAACIIITLTFGCCPHKNLIRERNVHDSVRIETNTVIAYVPDTVFIEIPAQSAERTAMDSTSHLENDYATSDARINADGTLFHSLKTKPQKKPVEVEKKVERTDTIIHTGHTAQETEEKIVEVTPPWAWYILLYAAGATVLAIILIKRKR